jgi:hypothetical protein
MQGGSVHFLLLIFRGYYAAPLYNAKDHYSPLNFYRYQTLYPGAVTDFSFDKR